MNAAGCEAQELSLITPDLRLAAQAWGEGDAAPVLALHGWLDNAASFAPLAPWVPGVRMVALDLPGHGRSEHRPPGILYHFVDFVADVVAAADALAWERFALLGHSLGAAVASFVAAVVPERVSRLALIEGLGPLTAAPADTSAQLAASLRERRRLRDKRLPVYASLEEAARARAAAGQGITLEAAMALAARGTRREADGVRWRSDPRLTVRSPAYLCEEQVLAVLRCIEAPAALIRAGSGIPHTRPFFAERGRQVAHLEVIDLPGGHHLHMETPRAVARALAPHLAER
ncbi:MAG: alpha/beta hydrolase [Gammaproteobacteria bacterium]|nr:alpha/beta hydrolase [Gammaproteobacteria bacterium]NIR84799.1 alpha/beta hydrolase [Gammaproteobacteria bacterium]NIR91513.1 alpha/beta hydrolase [Gammaproteobacteria bacterium]NIU05846.1 alpha/beta hydrolase [Gammaproteobacteria bacterium]NIV76701.1 alpha/beta fold hydrolase [Gammaproteobacteria bacterium]